MEIDRLMRILIVDRNKVMVRIIRSLLNQLEFHDVEDADNVTEALAKLSERSYGLVICDLNLELAHGYELLKHIRADKVLRNLPFIVVSGESDSEKLLTAKQAGVNTVIIAPFNAQGLKGKIAAELTNRRSLVRHRVLKHGHLSFDTGNCTMECLIRDLSERGAKVQVADAEELPSQLVLSFDDGEVVRPCLVRWRQGNALGIEFAD